MACRLFGAKPLSEPMLIYCQLDSKEHISMEYYSIFKLFHSRKCIWKHRLRNGGLFVSASMCLGQSVFCTFLCKYIHGPLVLWWGNSSVTSNTKNISVSCHFAQRRIQTWNAAFQYFNRRDSSVYKLEKAEHWQRNPTKMIGSLKLWSQILLTK